MTTVEQCIEVIQELERKVIELQEELDRHMSRTEGMDAETMVRKGREWVINNPKAWNAILSYARMCVENQKRFSIQKACEDIRDSNLVEGWEDFKINNSYFSVFSRILLYEQLPELEGLVELRPSKVDRYFK